MTGMERIRVVLADDDGMVRAGVRAILSSDAEIEVVAEAADGREAVESVRRHRPDVVLLDIRMPGLDGLAALPQIRRAAPQTAVMMLTTFGEPDYISRAVAEGAAAFVLKTGAPQELIMGARAAAEGGAFFSPRVARWLIDRAGPDWHDRRLRSREAVHALAPRHRDVLALVAEGRSNAQIARALHLTEGTVKAYVSALMERLGVENRVQAALMAHESDLFPRT
jgi:DNA-binding NarL/FixJ family response regulator